MCRTAVLFVLVMLPAVSAGAQWLPTAPVDAFDGRLVVGADAVVTLGAEDDTAFFNYTDYEHNTLRMFRLGLTASWRPASRIAVVGEIRSENFDLIRPYAAYVRVRPFNGHAFDVQIGRIPPSFGAFGRRGYNADQPFIGYPLAYQYLTSLRPDAVPAVVGDLLVMRGRGWLASYPVGSPQAAPGVPLISAFRWDTGIRRLAGRMVDVTGSVTSGTLSDPRVDDNTAASRCRAAWPCSPRSGWCSAHLLLAASFSRRTWRTCSRTPPARTRRQRSARTWNARAITGSSGGGLEPMEHAICCGLARAPISMRWGCGSKAAIARHRELRSPADLTISALIESRRRQERW
jgi:hypothetical protein